MTPPTPHRFPLAFVIAGVLAIAGLSGGAAALADAERLEQVRWVAAP